MIQPMMIRAIGGKSIKALGVYHSPKISIPNNLPEPNNSRKKATNTKIKA